MKRSVVMLGLLLGNFLCGASVFQMCPPVFLASLDVSDYVPKLYEQPYDREKKRNHEELCVFALREKLYVFQKNPNIVALHLESGLENKMPRWKGIAVRLASQFTGATKNSWEIDFVVNVTVSLALSDTSPPTSYADKEKWEKYVKELIMSLCLPN